MWIHLYTQKTNTNMFGRKLTFLGIFQFSTNKFYFLEVKKWPIFCLFKKTKICPDILIRSPFVDINLLFSKQANWDAPETGVPL